MVALDVLGRRGALRLLWELRAGPLTFRALQTACDTNPSSLNTRLKELRELRIVDHGDAGYFLTRHGHSLMAALGPLQTWAHRWAADTFESAVDQT
ncbi:transcriptional regulator [Mycobacterium cookii]|uniref:Transcriptional regulator n=2 Tax=Mycobacterium cookii TaxID=1775 RepID=A0A7I7KXV1_9MYCO|nr:transcriptional regulator [Mycobacterium cookii]